MDLSKYSKDTKEINLENNQLTEFSWKDAPQSLQTIYLYGNQITTFLWKDCPDNVIIYGLSNKHKAELREYRSAKKIQRVYLKHYTRRKWAAKKIQRVYLKHYTRRKWAAKVIAQGCHNWLYKPKCKDDTIGIVPRIGLSYL